MLGMRASFSRATKANIAYEEAITPWIRGLILLFGVGSTVILAECIMLYENGRIELFSAMAMFLFLFSLFNSIKHLYMKTPL